MNKLARGLATAAIASALIVAPAAAANAYVPGTTNPSAAPAIAPGAAGSVAFSAGTFAPGETVSFTLTGTNAAAATLVNTKTITKAATATGAVSVSVTLPSNASGTYSLTGTGVTSGETATQTIAVAAADSSAALPDTGSENSAAAFWFAGGLLALGATTVVTLNVVRRNRAQA